MAIKERCRREIENSREMRVMEVEERIEDRENLSGQEKNLIGN